MVRKKHIKPSFTRGILLVILSCISVLSGNCQTVESLKKQVESIQKDIKLAEELLKETSNSKEITLNHVSLLQTQISQREKLIRTYQNQVNALNKEINKNKNKITSLKKDLALFQKEYSDLLVITYRNKGKANNILFIFSSEDFNQAMRRMRYIEELNGMVKEKIKEIKSTQEEIENQLNINEQNKKEIEKILAKEKEENKSLIADRNNLNKDLTALKKKEGQIKKEIKEKEKQTEKLNQKIDDIIAEEIRKAKEREEIAKKNNTKSIDYNLSSNFEQNKGKLPFPVDHGIISSKYGKHQHPTLKNVSSYNNGIDISTTKGAKAKSIFEGEVCAVTFQGTNNVVLIRHGLYFSLYANLEKVYVKMGDKVETGEAIGMIHTNVSDGKTVLHLEIWHENKTRLNPSVWLRK